MRLRRRLETDDSARYDAFISYSHRADERIALAVRDALHAFSRPWYALRALRVFLDRASLAAAPDLWEDVRQRLDASRFLVILASPEAARSEWVGPREIVHWFSKPERGERLIIVCTDGEVVWSRLTGDFDWQATTALPRELRGRLRQQPLYVDMRWARDADHLALSDDRFLGAIAGIASPMHGRAKDDLVGEDIKQHRRTRRIVRVVIASLATLAAVATAMAAVAVVQRNRAEERARIATSRQLALEADTRATREPLLSALLSVAAYETEDTLEARGAMLRAADRLGSVRRVLAGTSDPARDPPNHGYSVAFSPDGTTLASGRENGAVLLWDVARGALRATLRARHGRVFDVAYRPDGRTLAAATLDGRVVLWSIAREAAIRELPGVQGASSSVAFSPDGRRLAIGGYDRIGIVDVASGRRIALAGHGGTAIRDVAFSPDGRLLASASHDSTLRVWDVARRRTIATFPHGWSVFGLAWAPDGRRVAAATQDGKVVVWDLEREKAMARFEHPGSVFDVEFSPNGETLAAAGHDGDVTLWSVGQEERIQTFTGEADATAHGVAFAPDGRTLASVGDGATILWDLSGRDVMRYAFDVDDVRVTDDGRYVVAAGFDAVVVRDARPSSDGSHPITYQPEITPANNIAVQGTTLAVAGYAEVAVFDIARRRRVAAFTDLDPAPLYSVALSSDGRIVAAGTESGKIVLWDVRRRRRIGTLPNAGWPPYAMEFSPDGRTLAVDSDDTVTLWDVGSRVRRGTLRGHTDHIEDIAFSPSGDMIATANVDETIRLWDPVRRTTLATLTGHTDEVNAVAFNSDGTLLASGGQDEKVRLWDVERRAGLGALTLHSWLVSDVDFAPDGTLYSASADETVALFDTSPESWRRHICERGGRDISPQERHALALDPELDVCPQTPSDQ